MPNPVSLGIAFLGGVVSFLSPCVIPLLPGYLSFLTGLSFQELTEKKRTTEILIPALLFVLGFSIVFTILGAGASFAGAFLRQYRDTLSVFGGVLVILMGIMMIDLIPVRFASREFRFDFSRSKGWGSLSGLLLGMIFAAGWTPCIGPVLAVILTLASNSGGLQEGTILLLSYSAGLAVPFLLIALVLGVSSPIVKIFIRHSQTIRKVSGVLLILLGILMVTGYYAILSAWLVGALPAVSVDLPSIAQ